MIFSKLINGSIFRSSERRESDGIERHSKSNSITNIYAVEDVCAL
jgi:hypothetical protein